MPAVFAGTTAMDRQAPCQSLKADRMNDVPLPTINETKPLRKKESSAGFRSAGLSDIAPCAEGDQLKQQYDSTLQEWTRSMQPRGRPFLREEASARLALQLREEALTRRNEAANRMYLHRANCAACRRRR